MSSTVAFGASYDAANVSASVHQTGTGVNGGVQGRYSKVSSGVNDDPQRAVWGYWRATCSYYSCDTSAHGSRDYQGAVVQAVYYVPADSNTHSWTRAYGYQYGTG